jgi:(p)ppGpp synthase/HD superfamily hydrolase
MIMRPRNTVPRELKTFHLDWPELDDDRIRVVRLGLRMAELEELASQGDGDHRDLAQDTLEHHVPLADRLGMTQLCTRLEDACFRLIDPKAYHDLARTVKPLQDEDAACLELLKRVVHRLLERNHVNATMEGRIKGLYSLHRKIVRRRCSVREIMDKIGLRILVPSVRECYLVLGLLHTHFCHVPGTLDDYIGSPKDNGYQSLHTCIYPVPEICDKPVEIQVRTHVMHQESEYGMAAHQLYKRRQRTAHRNNGQSSQIQELLPKAGKDAGYGTLMRGLRCLWLEDNLVVYGPKGRRMRLPAGSTLRTFAMRSGLPANQGSMARVNGLIRPMEYPLQDGDTVEPVSNIPQISAMAKENSEPGDRSRERRIDINE